MGYLHLLQHSQCFFVLLFLSFSVTTAQVLGKARQGYCRVIYPRFSTNPRIQVTSQYKKVLSKLNYLQT